MRRVFGPERSGVIIGALLAPLTLLWLAALTTAARAAPGSWSATGSMTTSRQDMTANLLPDGRVLIVGGRLSNGFGESYRASAERYDPATGTFSAAASMSQPRSIHTATLLPDGDVVVSGGYCGCVLASSERYRPATNTWTASGSLGWSTNGHAAALLGDGRVVAAGGGSFSGYFANAATFNAATNAWTAAPPMSEARYSYTATTLPNGKVLVAGGYNGSTRTASAQLFDPATNTWSAAGTMSTGRSGHTATLLPSGKVLVAGGFGTSAPLASAELYDPATNSWSAAGSLSVARQLHVAALLPGGRVLVAGGYDIASPVASAEVYDPATNAWTTDAPMSTARGGATATVLPSGKVLVAGGYAGSASTASAELYAPSNQPPTTPGAPALASGSATNDGVFALSWSPSTDPEASAVTYVLERRDADDAGFSVVATGLTSASYAFTAGSREAEGTWRYRVRASDGALSGAYSADSGLVKVDRSAPAAPMLTADRAPDYAGDGGWYLDTVTVSFAAAGDPLLADGSAGSGVDPGSVPAPAVRSTSGTHLVSGTVSDLVGNVSPSGSSTVRVDATDPLVSITCPSSDPIHGTLASAPWTASDAHSGLASASSGAVTLDTSTVGPHVAAVPTAVDHVGHTAGASCSYDVRGNFADEVAADAPQNSWRLGEPSGGVMTAGAGGNAGSYKNGVVLGQPGPLAGDANGAALFNGTSSYASVNGVAAPANAYTMEIFMKANPALQSGSLMDHGGAGALYIKTDRFCFRQTSTHVCWLSAPSTGVWYHIAGTWDNVSKVARLYVNGVERATATAPTAPSGSGTLYIGYGQSAPWFKGLLDEPAYYATALSAARIAIHYGACGC
jgi:N-acetylneuraminic acid mutarotase